MGFPAQVLYHWVLPYFGVPNNNGFIKTVDSEDGLDTGETVSALQRSLT
jgi:hypothetical protein